MGTIYFSKMLWSLCYGNAQATNTTETTDADYLFYFIWWELLHILQFVNILTMAIIVTEEITGALFQQVDDNAQARQVPVWDHRCLCIYKR